MKIPCKSSILDVWLGSECAYENISLKKNPSLTVFQNYAVETHNSQTNKLFVTVICFDWSSLEWNW